jgi:hypothetical protein
MGRARALLPFTFLFYSVSPRLRAKEMQADASMSNETGRLTLGVSESLRNAQCLPKLRVSENRILGVGWNPSRTHTVARTSKKEDKETFFRLGRI